MNTSYLKISILLLVLISDKITFGMESNSQEIVLYQPNNLQGLQKEESPSSFNQIPADVTINHLNPQVLPEDVKDLRLVCKNLAKKWPNWSPMPDSVEKEYDKVYAKKGTLNKQDKQLILCAIASKNNLKDAAWIINASNPKTDIIGQLSISEKFFITPSMLAKLNNNRDMGKLLIQIKTNENQNWKVDYKNISVPKEIVNCLYPVKNDDFSFLPYAISASLDNVDDLKTACSPQKPTISGLKMLLEICMDANAVNCFEYLSNTYQDDSKMIIGNNDYYYLKSTLKKNNLEIVRYLINNKLCDINTTCYSQYHGSETILDGYRHVYEDNIHHFLKELGAKYTDEIKEENKKAREIERINKIKNSTQYNNPICIVQ